MVIYLFRDEADNEKFALSVEVTGENIPTNHAADRMDFCGSNRHSEICGALGHRRFQASPRSSKG
jgi:hypothetical protein